MQGADRGRQLVAGVLRSLRNYNPDELLKNEGLKALFKPKGWSERKEGPPERG